MKYVVYNEKNNKVQNIYDVKPFSVMKGSAIAMCEVIPPINKANGEYYEVFNIQEHTETYTDKEPQMVKKIDELNNEEYTITEYVEVEKTRTHKTCELLVNKKLFNEKEMQKSYESLVNRKIRKKYSANDENKVVREFLSDMSNIEKKLQFEQYNNFVENCKLEAKGEIYGRTY